VEQLIKKKKVLLLLGVGLVFFLANALLSYQLVGRLLRNGELVVHTHEVLAKLEETIAALIIAESSQRGFLLTGDAIYLEPYSVHVKQVAEHLARFEELTADNPGQQGRAHRLRRLIDRRLAIIQGSLEANRTSGREAARQFVLRGRGHETMDAILALASEMKRSEERLLLTRSQDSAASGRLVLLSILAANLLGMALVVVTGRSLLRYFAERKHSEEALHEAQGLLEVRVEERTSDLALANQRLQQFTIELERSNRELQDFAFIASHDLQEPLRKIQAFGDRLRTKYGAVLGAEALDYLDRMQRAAQRMHTLINDLLTFSRVTSRGQPFIPVDLNRVAQDVLSDLEVRLQQSEGTVDLCPLPVIEADPTQMRQLLQNLIGNGLKFHRPGSPPTVRVESASVDDGAVPQVRLTVEDNGIGFDPKYLDRLFTPFQRLHGRAEYEGTGMGLAVCRRIVERHGGSVTAESQPGQGARFLVILPVQQKKGDSA
jgi:signal transduction histidine kinase